MEMGYCNLDELKRCRKRLDMSWTEKELLYILHSITKALETARSIRICHRDIKEKNIVVSD
jgi:serine/threonine protein kinase